MLSYKVGRQRVYNECTVLGQAQSLSWAQNWELDKEEVQPSSGKLPRCAACWFLPSKGMPQLRGSVCSGQGERDIAQISIGSGLGSSEDI